MNGAGVGKGLIIDGVVLRRYQPCAAFLWLYIWLCIYPLLYIQALQSYLLTHPDLPFYLACLDDTFLGKSLLRSALLFIS